VSGKENRLNERERRFVELVMGECVGNATEAYCRAYQTKNRNAAGVQAHRLLRKAKIRLAVEARVRKDPKVATREQRQAFWTEFMLDEKRADAVRLRGSELLGKSQGDFVEHHVLDAGESLYELLGGRPLPKIGEHK
jgi:hypothetical protein